jgi:hypothetical protein
MFMMDSDSLQPAGLLLDWSGRHVERPAKQTAAGVHL